MSRLQNWKNKVGPKFGFHYDETIVSARCLVLDNRLLKPAVVLSFHVLVLAKSKETKTGIECCSTVAAGNKNRKHTIYPAS